MLTPLTSSASQMKDGLQYNLMGVMGVAQKIQIELERHN
jgi:hypothetical protein